MDRSELLKNSGYWMAKIQLNLCNELSQYMNNNGIDTAELAKKVGTSEGHVSQALYGDFDDRLSMLVKLSLAMNKIPEIKFTEIATHEK